MKLNRLTCTFIILVFFIGCSPSGTEQETTAEITEIILSDGTNMAAALSPDGKTLAIDVLGRISLMSVNGGEAVPITDSLGNARQPSWSPDGQQLTFQAYWEGNWHIYVVNRDGSGLKKMTDGEYDHREPHWSPDGTTLLYSSDRGGSYDIWSRDIVGEQTNALTDGEANEFGPAWSPDGTQMAYVSDDKVDGGLYVADLTSGSKNKIYTTRGRLAGVAWSPSGNELVFNELQGAASILKRISSDGANTDNITREGEEAFPFRASWNSNNDIFYTADGKVKKLASEGVAAEVDFTIKAFLERQPYERKLRNFDSTEPQTAKGIAWPVISPDGSEVVFVALQDLWLRKSDGTLEQLSNDPYVQILPAWSRDGRFLAYSSDRSGPFGIWIRDMDTGEEKLALETRGSTSGLSWSPNGTQIAYTMSSGPRGSQLFVLNVGDGSWNPISDPLPNDTGTPTWSPDGETIALSVLAPYSSLYREGVNRVVLFSSDGTSRVDQEAPEHWSFGVRSHNGPIWSPDGKYMAAATRGTIWIVQVDKNGHATDFPIEITQELSDAPSWSGDSKRILFMATDKLKIVNIEDRSIVEVPIDLKWSRKLPGTRKVIHAGGLITGTSAEVVENVDVIIDGHRITAIEPHDDSRQADEKIDASDAFVMPGLIDLHAHEGSSWGERLGRAWLSWGVTTVRNPSADPYDEINRREAIQSGKALGPRLFLTGSPIDGSRIYYGGAIPLQSEAQIDMELNRADVLGYDLIKTYVRLADPFQQRVVDGAHAIGIPVTSHELYPAVSYNTDGTEHVSGTSRIGYSSKISRTWQAYDDVTDLLTKSGMSFTPTTAIIAYKYLINRDSSVRNDIRSKTFANMTGEGIPGLIDPSMMDDITNETLYKNLIKMVSDVHGKGGFVVAGTDSPIIPYGLALHMEMETYQDAGLEPHEIVRIATINNAIALNAQQDLGSVEAGKIADLIVLDKNPLENIKNTRSVRMVMKNGVAHKLEVLLERP